jgi:predicted metal-dependent phosphoesterase TrpH
MHSDGEPTTPGLVEHYARAGCDVLAITDHWRITLLEAKATILLLPSSELSARIEGGLEADILAYGIDELPEPREEFPSITEAARWIVAQGGVAYLAHPYWSGLAAEHYLAAPDLSGIEIYNGGSELLQGNGLSTVHWDDILQRGAPCLGIATDDSHYAGQDSRLGWTMVRAPERSRPAILDALRRGSFYSSTGAEIHGIEVHDDGHVDVRTSAARAVTLRSGRWDGCRVNAHPHEMHWRGAVVERAPDGSIVAARFEPPEFEKWGRVEVLGADGTRAWSNAFPVG